MHHGKKEAIDQVIWKSVKDKDELQNYTTAQLSLNVTFTSYIILCAL
jgi:hypothetical protein